MKVNISSDFKGSLVSEFCDHVILETDYPVKMYENLNIFVREDGDTPEDQILGLKTNDKVHSLEKYIQELDFADEMWRELYVLNEQLTRRFINVVDIVRTSSCRSICFTKVSVSTWGLTQDRPFQRRFRPDSVRTRIFG